MIQYIAFGPGRTLGYLSAFAILKFQVVSSLFPTLVSAGATLNGSDFPLAMLFAKSTSAGWYLLAIAVILVIIKALLPSGNK